MLTRVSIGILHILFGPDKSFLWLLVILVAYFVLRFNKHQLWGEAGEHHVKCELERLPQQKYKTLNDVLLRTSTGTTQIDHIVISQYGLFVIETKNYAGLVRGEEWENYWIHINGKYQCPFMNPIRQNYVHVKAIESALKHKYSGHIIPIVVFNDTCKLNVKNNKTKVVHLNKLLSYIRTQTKIVLKPEEAEEAYNLLVKCNIPGRKARREHVKRIKENRNARYNQYYT